LLLKAFSSLPQLSSRARLVARQHGFAERILDPVEEDFDLVTDLEFTIAAGAGKFAQRDAALGLQADIDDGHVFFDCNHLPLMTELSCRLPPAKGFVQHRGEIIARGIIRSSSTRSHLFSRCGICRLFGLRAYRSSSVGSANPDDRSLRRSQERAG